MDFSLQLSGAALTGNISPDAINSMGTLFGAAMGGIILFGLLIGMSIGILMIVSRWKVFKKAGLPGWGIFVPFYNRYLMFELGGISGRNFLWILIPPVFMILMIVNVFNITKKFGKDWTFGLGILFLKCIFIPILAFDNSTYLGKKSTTTYTTKTIITPAKKIIMTATPTAKKPLAISATKKVTAKKTPTKKAVIKKATPKKSRATTKPVQKKVITKKTITKKPLAKKIIKKKK